MRSEGSGAGPGRAGGVQQTTRRCAGGTSRRPCWRASRDPRAAWAGMMMGATAKPALYSRVWTRRACVRERLSARPPQSVGFRRIDRRTHPINPTTCTDVALSADTSLWQLFPSLIQPDEAGQLDGPLSVDAPHASSAPCSAAAPPSSRSAQRPRPPRRAPSGQVRREAPPLGQPQPAAWHASGVWRVTRQRPSATAPTPLPRRIGLAAAKPQSRGADPRPPRARRRRGAQAAAGRQPAQPARD